MRKGRLETVYLLNKAQPRQREGFEIILHWLGTSSPALSQVYVMCHCDAFSYRILTKLWGFVNLKKKNVRITKQYLGLPNSCVKY